MVFVFLFEIKMIIMAAEWIYILPVLSFFLSYSAIFWLRKVLVSFHIIGIDINKEQEVVVPEGGGLLALIGICICILILLHLGLINPIAYTFLFLMMGFAGIGFLDDGFKVFKREENWRIYVIKRGVVLFFFSLVFSYIVFHQLGYSLPLVVGIAALIVLSSALSNSFAGLNGWEVGSSLIILSSVLLMVSLSQLYTQTLVFVCLVVLGSVAALFYFNKYPARIFPGDSGTLMIGAFIGALIPFINPWYLALPLFLPHIYDIYLKIRTNPHDISQKSEKPYVISNGVLHVPASRKMDFAKKILSIYGAMPEQRVVRRILGIVLLNSVVWTCVYVIARSL